MPVYDYRCKDCSHDFVVIESLDEHEDHEDHEDDDARSDEWLAGFQAAIDTVAAHSVIFAREDHSVIFALNLLKAALADPARAEAALEGIAALGLANPTSGMTP